MCRNAGSTPEVLDSGRDQSDPEYFVLLKQSGFQQSQFYAKMPRTIPQEYLDKTL